MTARFSRSRLTVGALYAGGFLGPFGGGVVTSMLPELGRDFHVSPGTASLSLTAYMSPFALLMLVSGTLGQRWGPLRTVRVAYLAYALVSVLCVLPGPFAAFLGFRVLQGTANAFTSPLLLASVAAMTPRHRLGRALGLFGALQAAGQTSAPLLGGAAAEFSWRWAFVGVAVVAGVLAAIGLPAGEAADRRERVRLRTAMRPEVLRVGVVALVGWGCLGGLGFLISFRAVDFFGLGAGARGLLLTALGVAGMLTARVAGRAVDFFGARAGLVAGTGTGAVFIALAGMLPSIIALAVMWSLAGVASQLVLVGANTSALSTPEGNRGGAVSVVQAFRFVGAAATPVAFTPIYHATTVGAFLTPAALLLLAGGFSLWRKD
ncbi:MAG: MFS transporter [Sciscionella sp.]|nr:MFS transporter [Sciscionella sp.]